MVYVYKISGNGLDYYGSSSQNPVERKSKHKVDYRFYLKQGNTTDRWCCSSNKIFDSYGDGWEIGDWTFEIIAEFDTEQEALEYENNCIINEPCVNTNRSIGLTGDEMRKYKAEWAMNKRRAEGIPKRQFIKTEEDKEKYLERTKEKNRLYMQEKRATMSSEEKEAQLAKRREQSKSEEAKAKAKEYFADPEIHKKRMEQQNILRKQQRANETPEQKEERRQKAREAYAKR
jgi:hypothetical protein